MANGAFVAYYRVSTAKQGKSGVGIEAQREAVENYLNGGKWRIGELVGRISVSVIRHPAVRRRITVFRLR
jgi:DNA invertase Pin-like site-specific DNA recombinase